MVEVGSGGLNLAGVLNPQYPSSWWAIGFSHEVRVGEVVPVVALERELVLWRDDAGALHCHSAICPHLGANIGFGGAVEDGTLRCPFHGWRYDTSGGVCHVPGNGGRVPPRVALTRYRVEERFGEIFVWNGLGQADHEVPDVMGEMLAESPELGEEGIRIHHDAWFMPFPAKWFIENLVDAAHLVAVHRLGESSDVEIVEETPWKLRFITRVDRGTAYLNWRRLREDVRRGELTLLVRGFVADFDMTTYGGGIHVDKLVNVGTAEKGRLGDVVRRLSSARVITAWTPVKENSHIVRFTFLTPAIGLPLAGRVLERLMYAYLVRRDWGGNVQDGAVMLHRCEQPEPAYARLDRGLVKFRRFWDSRLLDRSLWAGDNVHSNGLRAGVRWEDRPGAPAVRAVDISAPTLRARP